MQFDELIIVSGLIAGLVGSVHCVVMCGGLVGVISASLKSSRRRAVTYWVNYHFGRILSYTIAGILAGSITGQISSLFPVHRAHVIGSMIAGIFLVILGGHVAQWWNLLSVVETAGGRLWQKIVPIFAKIVPPKALHHAIIGGLLWGWIPCGLVYSTLVLAASTADPINGGLTMAAFGIGTLPMLLAMGMVAKQLEKLKFQNWLRMLSGTALCALGVAVALDVVPLHISSQGM